MNANVGRIRPFIEAIYIYIFLLSFAFSKLYDSTNERRGGEQTTIMQINKIYLVRWLSFSLLLSSFLPRSTVAIVEQTRIIIFFLVREFAAWKERDINSFLLSPLTGLHAHPTYLKYQRSETHWTRYTTREKEMSYYFCWPMHPNKLAHAHT